VTSQPQPPPVDGKPAGQFLRPLRDLAAYALVGATAVLLFVALLKLIPDSTTTFSFSSIGSFDDFVNLPTILFPLGAVLLSVLIQPRHPKAQLIVLAAAVEYGVAAVFGLLFGVLIGLINIASNLGALSAFEGLLERVAWLAVFGVAGYAVFQLWRNLYFTPRPKPQPGVYGTPQYGQPGTFPGQPGYGPPPGQPGFPAPQGGFPPPPGQQGYGPGVYGQPGPAWNQPSGPFPTAGQPTQPVPPGPFVPPTGSPVVPPPMGSPVAPPTGSPVAPPSGTVYPAPPQAVVPQGGYVYPADEVKPSSPAATQPVPADPTQTVPQVPPPAAETQAVPQTSPPAADPTQVVPQVQPSPLDDRTEKIGKDRPGFGPADPDKASD